MAQVALITGGAVRIGKAIALRLAEADFSVAVQYRNSEAEAESTVAAIKALGRNAACFQADLGDHAEVEKLIPAVNAALGCMTCLVNNASYFADDRLPSLTEAEWQKHMAVNLTAPVFLAQSFAAQLPEISSTSSISASLGPTRFSSPIH